MGAKVIAFDGVLAEPDRSSPRFVLESIPETEEFEQARMELITLEDHDEILARAIGASKVFVSGYTFASYSQTPDRPRLVKGFLAKKEARAEFLKAAPKFQVAAVFLKHLESEKIRFLTESVYVWYGNMVGWVGVGSGWRLDPIKKIRCSS